MMYASHVRHVNAMLAYAVHTNALLSKFYRIYEFIATSTSAIYVQTLNWFFPDL
jgi:hypothetical protein